MPPKFTVIDDDKHVEGYTILVNPSNTTFGLAFVDLSKGLTSPCCSNGRPPCVIRSLATNSTSTRIWSVVNGLGR